MNRTVSILIAVFLATSLAATSYALATNSLFGLRFPSTNRTFGLADTNSVHQGISGKAVIANVSPVCALTGSQPATGPSLVITSVNGKTIVLAIDWALVNRCALVSQFQVPLQPGTYSVTLSPCSYLGCSTLPITVAVEPGAFTPVDINIVTGIY